MKLHIAAAMVFGFAGCFVFASDARAQRPVPALRPTVSPYLNLLRRDGGGIGFQYYQRVLPQREFRNAYRQQMQSLNFLNRRINRLEKPGPLSTSSRLGQTGHPTRFQSFGGYNRSRGRLLRSGPRNR